MNVLHAQLVLNTTPLTSDAWINQSIVETTKSYHLENAYAQKLTLELTEYAKDAHNTAHTKAAIVNAIPATH